MDADAPAVHVVERIDVDAQARRLAAGPPHKGKGTPMRSLVADQSTVEFWRIAFKVEGIEVVPSEYRELVIESELDALSHPKTGFAYFLRHYCVVRIKGGSERGWRSFCPGGNPRVDPKTGKDWGWQLLLAEVLPLYDIFLVLKARQIGLTFIAAAYGLWKCLFFNDSVGIVIANKMGTSERLVRRVRDMYRHLPEWLQDEVPMLSDGVRMLTWANGSSLEPMSSAPDTGRSEAASFVLIDETAKIDKQEEMWGSVEPCADSGGQIVMFSTADGVGDMFHTWCVDSANGAVQHVLHIETPDGPRDIEVTYGDAGMGFVFLPNSLHPQRDEAWYEAKRKTFRFSLATFEQEYPETWEQAFIASGLNYFSIRHVEEKAIELRRLTDRDRRGSLVWVDRKKKKVKFVDDPYGDVLLHSSLADLAEMLRTGRPFVIGADCSGDNPWGDFQAASAVHVGNPYQDREETLLQPPASFVPHVQVMTIHGQMGADDYGENLEKMGYLLSTAVIAVEANGVGTGVIAYLKRNRYPKLWVRTNKPTSKNEKPTTQIGWWTSAEMKHVALGKLDVYLRNGVIDIRDIDCIDEMRSVVHLGNNRVGAPEPRHDDRVMSLAIACVLASRASERVRAMELPVDDPVQRILDQLAEEAARDDVLLGNEMAGYDRKYLEGEPHALLPV